MNDFGRQVDVTHRFDDFAKLHESLVAVLGSSVPALPPKNMFGGNDPKVVEERRPMLEKLVRESMGIEKVWTSDSSDAIYKFLGIHSSGATVIKFLCPSSRKDSLPKLAELIQGEASDENYRLFTEPVLKVLLSVIQTGDGQEDTKGIISALDVLQFILSRAHALETVDVQSVFVALGGINIVWTLLVRKREVRDNCRRVLSSLISSNSGANKIEKYEELLLEFLSHHNGLSLLHESPTEDEKIDEIMSKLIWFGLSESVQRSIANHTQGLALLGRLYSSRDLNARTLAGLTLCVLITNGMMEGTKKERAIEGVSSILGSLIDSESCQGFMSSVCRGSPNGLNRILFCIERGASPMSDLCSHVVLNASLSADLVDRFEVENAMESAILSSEPGTVVGMNAARFLFRQFSLEKRLPRARNDGKISILLAKIQTNLAEFNRTSKRHAEGQHKQFFEFSKHTLTNQICKIQSKEIVRIDFAQFEALVADYDKNRSLLAHNIKTNSEAIASLGSGLYHDPESQQWLAVPSDLVKEWNASLLGISAVRARVNDLNKLLSQKEGESKSAEADSENLQQVVTKMRQEIMSVDSRAEEFRKESSRFSAAAAGAVDSDLMIQRAQEAEANAKQEIAKREALRQSQDSLESQLETVRRRIVKAETDANETRKAIAETSNALTQAERMHKELEDRFRSELTKTVLQWNEKLNHSENQLSLIRIILASFDDINKLIATENEQKDLIVALISDLIKKLQSVQTSIAQ